MVQTKNLNLSIVKKFRQKAGKIVKISKMIFFGSRTQGHFSNESDFDLIVVSDDFGKQPFYKRAVGLYAAWKEDYPLELICYTKKEFREKQSNPYTLAAQAVKTGITIQ